MGSVTFEDIKDTRIEHLKELSNWDQIRAPGLHSSMSMSDLVSHLENRISEQGASNNPTLSSEEWQSLQILDDINRCLFSDTQQQSCPDSDEKSLMSRVNSLCCLLQKDPVKGDNSSSLLKGEAELCASDKKVGNGECEDTSGQNHGASGMSRKDSVGELLLNLPRIASLPQFLFNISEDFENQAR